MFNKALKFYLRSYQGKVNNFSKCLLCNLTFPVLVVQRNILKHNFLVYDTVRNAVKEKPNK